MKFLKKNFFYILLILFSLVVFALCIRINIFRYQNFEFGKFDLGNMVQMVWNSLHGKIMYLTDYFGTNMPRWGMSHVDPILLLFVPIFALFPHPLTLVFSQLALVIFSSLLIYKIAELELSSQFAAAIFGFAYLAYPALGYLLSWTGFHGVTAVIPFFLAAFYVFEKMNRSNSFTKKGLIYFWVFLVLAMMGKEEIPLFVFMFGLFVVFFRKKTKLGVSMALCGILWFLVAFFVIIPANAHYRVDGYKAFAQSIGISLSPEKDVLKPNYFLSRYEDFGDSYIEVAINMLLSPKKTIRVFFGGDKLENLDMTLRPMGYISLLYPPVFAFALPEFAINYLTTAGGIGTSEIYNHRISMIIPILFVSAIYAVGFLSKNFSKYTKVPTKFLVVVFSGFVLLMNIYTTFEYENPVFLWLTQSVKKRVSALIAYADTEEAARKYEIGDVIKTHEIEVKDRECAGKIVQEIPDKVSVSGPDHLGAHLAMRETYAIFPALFDSADYVIVDVFARKVLTILEVPLSLVNGIVGKVMKNPNYELTGACGNLFVFRRVSPGASDEESLLLPIQEKFEYEEKFDYDLFKQLTVVDYSIPEVLKRGKIANMNFVYTHKGDYSLDGYFIYSVFENTQTGDVYKFVHLPSFGLNPVGGWVENHYYTEEVEFVFPSYMPEGVYNYFVSITNNSRTRNMFLGEISVL